ncbi:hypothetical protein APY03_0429 [Variovorax sp. WDL1]|nr:hypothetical protein APY03_0429 [Variovorax sp. WDL1]
MVGALELYKLHNDGQMPTGDEQQIKDTLLQDGKYLKAWPQESWRFSTDYAFRAEVSSEACAAVNKKLGIEGVPQCSDTAYEAKSVCCAID